jgi:hypothetical protein
MRPIAIAVTLAALLASPAARSEYQLPVYTYSIRSGDFTETQMLMQSFERVIPGTAWLCSVSVITSGLTATCRTPNVRLQTGEEIPTARVAIRASCAGNRKADEQTVHLSDLDGGFARITIACNRLDESDDGF